MLLPVELVDRIFSFLDGDSSALNACSRSHPLLYQIAERYYYTDMVLTMDSVSHFYQHFSKNPRALAYPRTLDIRVAFIVSSPLIRKILSSLVPRMINLTSLYLLDRIQGNGFYHAKFLSALEVCLQQSPVQEIHLTHFQNLPLSVLDNGKAIKKLTLYYCKVMKEPMSQSPYCLLETLVIRSRSDMNLLIGMIGRVPNLKSLQLRGMSETIYDSDEFPELLAACSSSMTELHIDVGDRHGIYSSTNVGGQWIQDDLRHFSFTLSRQKSLKQLSISTLVSTTETATELRIRCALPAIIKLIKTAPAVRDVILRLHWIESDIDSFARLDWSPLVHLQSDFPGVVHLCISIKSRGYLISPEIILGALAGNDALMSVVKRGMVVLKPLAECPDG